MRKILAIASVAILCTLWVLMPASAQTASVDQSTSDAVTKYLHAHKLPMVGAQVSNGSSGRQLMLYGYVATDFGKHDAETKSKRYLHDTSIAIVNNIRVNPQVRHLKKRGAPPDEGGGDMSGDPNAMPPKAEWENTFDNTLRSGGAVPSNDPSLKMPPPDRTPPPGTFP